MLKEKVFDKMNELGDSTQKIIFQKNKITSESLEIYIVITKLPIGFRIYEGTKYESSISVEYFTIEEDMFKAMTSTLKINLGEVQ